MKKGSVVLSYMFILIVLILCVVYITSYKASNGYDTIGGVTVTRHNIEQLVPKVSHELVQRVHQWFTRYPESYTVLVKQRDFLTEVGNSASDCNSFFKQHEEVQNIGGINYIIKMSDNNFVMKISGPSTRFYNTAMQKGLGMKRPYFRRVYIPGSSIGKTDCNYISFEEDKELIKEYFNMCVPNRFLQQAPTRKQLCQLAYMVCGALAYYQLAGVAEYQIYEKLFADVGFQPKTIKQAFDIFLDYAFEAIEPLCYKKSDIAGKMFSDTYNVASRVFHMARFNEAIDRFGLNHLKKPPPGYIIHVNSKKLHSCADKDVVFLQQVIQHSKPIDFYMKHNRAKIYEVFDEKTILQFCRAIAYSGLWDINGDNILIDERSWKVTYIDFEHNRDVTPEQLFNANEKKVQRNICEAMTGLLRLFRDFESQTKAIYYFIEKNNIDLHTYIKESKQVYKRRRNYKSFSPLGWLLCYKNIEDEACQKYKHQVYEMLKRSV